MAASQIPRPPAGLGARGKALWREIHAAYELDPLETALLAQLAGVLDRCDAIAAELRGQPLMTSGSVGQPRVNPLLGALREEEKLADRLASSLAISMPGAAGVGKGVARGRKAAQTRWRRSRAAGSVTAIGGA